MEETIIIEMTPFLFEDGNTYYFKIVKREYSNDYHNLFVYEKVTTESKSFWGKVKVTEKFNNLSSPELVSTSLNTHELKNSIRRVLISTRAKYQLKDWDGFVGDVPEDVKKSLKREGKLKNILGE